ncbi:AraC family transcriptional regulator [Nocardia spumae]|uniref:AraC family transcriptional regulator n=1 Tax=Nocardia spumae TaxID=2887190 RepID=UPI001D15AE28|nr:AraC family transcriptional regulator [Nocardia spumae]
MMIAVGLAHGLDETLLLAGTGITPADLTDEEPRIWPEQEFAVARNLIRAVGDRPGLGAQTAAQATLGKAGLVGLAALASATMRDVLTIAIRYQDLVSVAARYHLEDSGGDEVALVADGSAIPADLRGFFVEREVALIFVAGRALDVEIPAVRLELELDAERAAALAEFASVEQILSGCERTALVLPRSFLELTMPHADSHTASLIERQCREALQLLLSGGWKLSTAVRERLLRDPGTVPSMAEVAAELHINVRTLRRQLAAEGSSFRGLLNTVRESTASELLRAGSTVEDVARRLGYAETANFTHAFTRWMGMSPRAYRRSLTRDR